MLQRCSGWWFRQSLLYSKNAKRWLKQWLHSKKKIMFWIVFVFFFFFLNKWLKLFIECAWGSINMESKRFQPRSENLNLRVVFVLQKRKLTQHMWLVFMIRLSFIICYHNIFTTSETEAVNLKLNFSLETNKQTAVRTNMQQV